MAAKHRIVLVEDNPSIREAIHRQGADATSFALKTLDDPKTQFQPEHYGGAACALFGLSRFECFGRQRAERIEEIRKITKIVLLLRESDLPVALDYIDSCDGFLFVDRHLDRLADVIDLTIRGYCLLPASLLPGLVSAHLRLALLSALSRNERKVLALLGLGLTNRTISQRLSISEATVKNLVRSVLKKMHFRNRTEAGLFAHRHVPTPPIRTSVYSSQLCGGLLQ